MSLRSLVDIVINVESFRNIDMFYQGLYYLQFKLYSEIDNKKIYAHPYAMCDAYKQQNEDIYNSNNQQDGQIFKDSSIIQENSQFCTKQFFIKFCEEQIDINDFCHFRIEYDVKPDYQKQNLIMEVDLMYLETKIQEKENSSQKREQELKCLTSSKYKIKDILTQHHDFIPIIFDDQHFGVGNILFHSMLFDFRYRISDLQLSDYVKIQDKLLEIQEFDGKKTEVNSFYDYLQDQYKNSKQVIDYDFIYDNMVQKVKDTFEELYENYSLVYSKCISNKHQKLFKHLLDQPYKLIIPENIQMSNQKKEFMKNSLQMESQESELVCNQILNEIHFISGQIYQLWCKYLDLNRISPKFVTTLLKQKYNIDIKQRWSESIFRHQIITKNFSTTSQDNIGQKNQIVAQQRRNNEYYKNLEPMNIQDLNMFPEAKIHPILFEQIYCKDEQDYQQQNENIDYESLNGENDGTYKGIHLFVLVHGFQGNSWDMRLIKNNLSLLHSEFMFLCSSCNQKDTDQDINILGKNLAKEVKEFIEESCPIEFLGRLSFIGHSLGGVIIRAALPHLEEFSSKMFTYLSLSSPHLGYTYSKSTIIDAGLFFLKQMKTSVCLDQLTMSDHTDIEQTFLFKLSSAAGMNWFKNVLVVSSYQDQYVPFDSQRIEICTDALNDQSSKGKNYVKMASNILQNILTPKLYRIDVNFSIPDNNIDSFIGRAAHILFLDCSPLIRMLFYNNEELFK